VAIHRATKGDFDGVELHGSGGLPPEQFLSSGTNPRTHEYGGSIPNRARFMLEVLGVMIAKTGPVRVGLTLSPEWSRRGY
jgi:N-ethylmaleimide reductase